MNSTPTNEYEPMPWSLFWIISRLVLFGAMSITAAVLAIQRNRIQLDILVGVYSMIVACKLYDRRRGIIAEAYGWFVVLFWCDIVILGLGPLTAIPALASPFRVIPYWLIVAGDALFCRWAMSKLNQPAFQSVLLQPSPKKLRITMAGMLMSTLVMAAMINVYYSELRRHPFGGSRSSAGHTCASHDSEWIAVSRRMPWGYKQQYMVVVRTHDQLLPTKQRLAAKLYRDIESELSEKTDSVLFITDETREWLDIDLVQTDLDEYLQKSVQEDQIPTLGGLVEFVDSRR